MAGEVGNGAAFVRLGHDGGILNSLAARDAMQRFMALKRQKMAGYPDDDVEKWRSYLFRVIPIADPASREKLFEGFRNAGLPV